MRNLKRFFTAIIVGLFFVSLAAADTLELKSGRVVQGKYLGGTQHILRFEVNGEVQTFSTNDIVALTFTGRSSSPAPAVRVQPVGWDQGADSGVRSAPFSSRGCTNARTCRCPCASTGARRCKWRGHHSRRTVRAYPHD